MKKNITYLCLFFLTCGLACLPGGCSTRGLVVNQVAEIMEQGVSAFESEDDLVLLENSLPANIKLIETLHANSPNNRKILVLLARIYAAYNFVTIEGKLEKALLEQRYGRDNDDTILYLKEQSARYSLRGMEYAIKSLEIRYPGCRKNLSQTAKAVQFISSLKREDSAALFWYGYHLSVYINHNRHSIKTVSKAYMVELIMRKIIELDPTYFNGGPHLVLFLYYGSRSPMMGGNLKKAFDQYRQVKATAGVDYYLADLYFARYYLVQTQDKDQFIATLEKIIQTPARENSYRFYNKMAYRLAVIYLEHTDLLFD